MGDARRGGLSPISLKSFGRGRGFSTRDNNEREFNTEGVPFTSNSFDRLDVQDVGSKDKFADSDVRKTPTLATMGGFWLQELGTESSLAGMSYRIVINIERDLANNGEDPIHILASTLIRAIGPAAGRAATVATVIAAVVATVTAATEIAASNDYQPTDEGVVLSETKAHRISRYKLGLQDELALFTAQSLSKVVEMAKRAETKLKPAAYSSYSAPAVDTTAATTTTTAATLGEERLNQRLVWALYVALRARDVDRVHNLLAPDIEWWFHGPPLHQHMTPLLTGTSSSDKKVFTFLPSSITVFGSTVLVEGCSRDGLVSWIHAWKVNNGLITELREYFNTSLSVRRIENINQSSPSTSPSSVSSSSSSSSYCLPLWESRISDNIGKSVPGIVLALF
ncbi:hypothetical protein GIB67_020256 [Kingdonia uniflora]|uniref:Uncharacterized protein n=1 Tax=Kingdonia uniflora TaxID=39325 RepID=A0A7J7P4L2_9MAGN|nr:hypothetical protein GIB67_020256 [Kingdonia uniflora]